MKLIHHAVRSLRQLRRLQEGFTRVNSSSFFSVFPRHGGSWEFAAGSVFNDAHYQLGDTVFHTLPSLLYFVSFFFLLLLLG